jgi:hypothetical protein
MHVNLEREQTYFFMSQTPNEHGVDLLGWKPVQQWFVSTYFMLLKRNTEFFQGLDRAAVTKKISSGLFVFRSQ